MKLEDQVTSLELSKKLKELGVKQESLFWWTRTFTRKSGEYKEDSEWYLQFKKNGIGGHYSAFTVAELGELLPKSVNYENNDLVVLSRKSWSIKNNNSIWFCGLYIVNGDRRIGFYADTEANARAKCLQYLLEENIISVNEINKRL